MRCINYPKWCMLMLFCPVLLLAGCQSHPVQDLAQKVSADWFEKDADMRSFLPLPWTAEVYGHEPVSLEEYCRRKPSLDAPYVAALMLQQMTYEEKVYLALLYSIEFGKSLSRLGLDPSSWEFATEFKVASYSKKAVFEADKAMWRQMSDWDGVWQRTVAQLPPEQQKVLAGKGAVRVMDCYGGYMLARYVERNPRLDRHHRDVARSVVSLFDSHADGEVGYRSSALGPREAYRPMRSDPVRTRKAYENRRFKR